MKIDYFTAFAKMSGSRGRAGLTAARHVWLDTRQNRTLVYSNAPEAVSSKGQRQIGREEGVKKVNLLNQLTLKPQAI